MVAELPAESFSLPEFRYTSRGSWAACAVCEELVRAGDRDALLVRSVITFIAKEELDEFTLGGATAGSKVKLIWIPREENGECDVLSKNELHRRGVRFRLQPEAPPREEARA